MDDTADQTLSQSKLMRVKTQKKGTHTLACYHSFYYSLQRVEVAVEAKVSWNHYELFQIVLQAQADAIVKLGFKPVVKVFNNHNSLYSIHYFVGLHSNVVVSLSEALWCEEVRGRLTSSKQ